MTRTITRLTLVCLERIEEHDSVLPSQSTITVDGEEIDDRPTLRKCGVAPVVSLDLYRRAVG